MEINDTEHNNNRSTPTFRCLRAIVLLHGYGLDQILFEGPELLHELNNPWDIPVCPNLTTPF